MNIGKHYIVELNDITNDCFENLLNKSNFNFFSELIESDLKDNGMNIISKQVHHFNEHNGAFTLLFLLSESHLSMHSWPEYNYLALDIFTCGNCDSVKIIDKIIQFINPGKYHIQEIHRGPL